MADQTKNTAPADVKVKNRQVNATIPEDVWSDLEGYAFGTRRKLSGVIRDIVLDFYEQNKGEIDARKV